MKPIVWWAGQGKSHIHHQLGLVAQIAAHHRSHGRLPMACLKHWTEPALRHRQIGFFFDEHNHPVGYVTWAWFDESTQYRWIADPNVLLHESEWNEGSLLWFLDAIVHPSYLREALTCLAEIVFPNQASAAWVIRGDDGRVRRVTRATRRDHIIAISATEVNNTPAVT